MWFVRRTVLTGPVIHKPAPSLPLIEFSSIAPAAPSSRWMPASLPSRISFCCNVGAPPPSDVEAGSVVPPHLVVDEDPLPLVLDHDPRGRVVADVVVAKRRAAARRAPDAACLVLEDVVGLEGPPTLVVDVDADVLATADSVVAHDRVGARVDGH